ncbi:MAG: addiction module toxin RelE [Sphingopyxis sp.]|nr:addiction module toxin RelE [Sphingopyxis sp.]
MRIVISKPAGRALLRSNKRGLLTAKIEELAADPAALANNIIRLQGRESFRLRVQDWRIIFRMDPDTLFVDEIEPRGSAYEDRT